MRVTTADYSVYSSRSARGYLMLHRHGGPEHGYYWTGAFMHPRGIVQVYRQHDYTRLSFADGLRVCHRSWERYWGDRTISRLAREFIQDLLS